MQVGFINGVFDCFHAGHKHLLMQCSAHCEYLIVAVNSDASVMRLKGPTRPIDGLAIRMHNVHKFADAVIPFDGYEEGLLVHIKPAIFFRGYDHSIDVTMGSAQVAHGNGCAIVQISHLAGFSTTEIVNASNRHA